MNGTILITGASSGIGRETALLFSSCDWNVLAASRSIEKMQADFKDHANIFPLEMDVSDPVSIKKAIKEITAKNISIDVLVNNAGFALKGAFEYSKPEQIKKEFETNVFGLMDLTREVIPMMRSRGSGTIINISSIGGLIGFPLYSLYQATKFAVEGFSESLSYELRQFNIRVKIVEPGLIQTNFYESSMDHTSNPKTDYDDFIKGVDIADKKNTTNASKPIVIAKCIYKAANDGSNRLRYHAGKNASLLISLKKILPDSMFFGLIRSAST